MIYLLIGIMILAGIVFHDIPHSQRHLRFWSAGFWVVIAILVLLAGLRYRIGMDTVVMEEGFKGLPRISDYGIWTIDRRCGGRHSLLLSLCKTLGLGVWPIELFCATVLNLSVGWMIRRYTRNWFVALAFYFVFALVPLNFETMWQGLATGCLVASIEDLRKGRLSRFYLKLFLGACAHLSIIVLFWLPALHIPTVRRWFRPGLRLLLIPVIIIVSGFILKLLLLSYNGFADNIEILHRMRFTTEGIRMYSESMLQPPPLNYKGITERLIIYVIIPACAAFLLFRGGRGACVNGKGEAYTLADDTPSGASEISKNDMLAIMMILFASFHIATLFINVFMRISFYFLVFTCIGGAQSLAMISDKKGKACWWCAALFVTAMGIYNYFGKIPWLNTGRLYELYIPYSSYLEKGISHHREWYYFNQMRVKDGKSPVEEENFYFSLEPDSYYLDPPLCDTTKINTKDLYVSQPE